MSEIHTLRGRVAEFDRIARAYEDQAAEREYEIARSDAERAAAEASLRRAQQAEKDRANRQAQINDQLQGEMRNLRVKQEDELKKIRQSNNQEIQKLNNEFNEAIKATQKKNVNDIKQLRIETKTLIDDHKAAVQNVTNKLKSDVKTLSQDIQSIQNKNITDKNEKLNFVNDAFNALDVMLQMHEKDERSPMKHEDTKPQGYGLEQVRSNLNSYRSQIKADISVTVLDNLFNISCDELGKFEEKTWTAQSEANKMKADFSSILAGMDTIINHAEKNASFKINALVPEKSCDQKEDNTWSEEREEKIENVDYWLHGEFQKILEKRKAFLEEIKKLDSSTGIHPMLTKKYLEELQRSSTRWETDFNEMRQKARSLAVNSNQRMVEAHRTYEALKNKFGSTQKDIGFEMDDPRSRVHLSCKVNGYDRHFILGCDQKDPKEILLTVSQGEDHHNSYASIQANELQAVMDTANRISLKDEAGNSPKLKSTLGEVCGEVKKYKQGMTEIQLKENGQLSEEIQ